MSTKRPVFKRSAEPKFTEREFTKKQRSDFPSGFRTRSAFHGCFYKVYSKLSESTVAILCACSLLCGSGLIFLALPHFLHRPAVVNSVLAALCVQTKEGKNTSAEFASTSKPREAPLMQYGSGV